jgi:hypothetical protein
MWLITQELRGFFDSAPKGSDRNPWPSFLELFDGEPIGKHRDDLSNPDAGAFSCIRIRNAPLQLH